MDAMLSNAEIVVRHSTDDSLMMNTDQTKLICLDSGVSANIDDVKSVLINATPDVKHKFDPYLSL